MPRVRTEHLGVAFIVAHEGRVILPLIAEDARDGLTPMLAVYDLRLEGRAAIKLGVDPREIELSDRAEDVVMQGNRIAAIVGDAQLYLWQLNEKQPVLAPAWSSPVERGDKVLGFDDSGNLIVYKRDDSAPKIHWLSPEGELAGMAVLPEGSSLARGDAGVVLDGDKGEGGVLVPTFRGLVRVSMAGGAEPIYSPPEGVVLHAGTSVSQGLYAVAINRRMEGDFAVFRYHSQIVVIDGHTGEIVAESEEAPGTSVRIGYMPDARVFATLGSRGVAIWTWEASR